MNGEKKKSRRMYSLYLYVAVAAGLLLSSCSGALTEKEKSAHSVFITISSDRTVRPEMTAVTEWTLTAVRSGAETDSSTFTLASEGGTILLKEGTYMMSLSGTNKEGITFSGKTDGIVVDGAQGFAVVITVTPALTGEGSLDYTMTLTDAFATQQELSAMLLSVKTQEEIIPIPLTVTVESDVAHITGQNISAGYYNLVVLYNTEVNLAGFTDSLIEIAGGLTTSGSSVVSKPAETTYYISADGSGNGLWPFSPSTLTFIINQESASGKSTISVAYTDSLPDINLTDYPNDKTVSVTVWDGTTSVLQGKYQYKVENTKTLTVSADQLLEQKSLELPAGASIVLNSEPTEGQTTQAVKLILQADPSEYGQVLSIDNSLSDYYKLADAAGLFTVKYESSTYEIDENGYITQPMSVTVATVPEPQLSMTSSNPSVTDNGDIYTVTGVTADTTITVTVSNAAAFNGAEYTWYLNSEEVVMDIKTEPSWTIKLDGSTPQPLPGTNTIMVVISRPDGTYRSAAITFTLSV